MKHTVHDGNKRKDADVTKKGSGCAIPHEQWEKIVNATPSGVPNDPMTAWDAMPSKERPRMHRKINECDY